MSLVGTRPPTVDEWDKYELHHRARLATKPGLTGMWQVSGRSNITDFMLPFTFLLMWTAKEKLLKAKGRQDENFGKGYISGKYGGIPMLNVDFANIVSKM